MDRKLVCSAILKFSAGVLLTALLLFVPAGSLSYGRGWLLMGILFVPMFISDLLMMAKNPQLLRKRLNAREEQKEQQQVIRLSGLMFAAGFAAAGFTYRWGALLPQWVSTAATVLFLIAYGLYGEVLRENTYLSRTVEVQENQKVIDTGLYGIVRHPMYSVTLLLFLMIPLVLGSFWAFLLFLAYPWMLVGRIHNEEQVLEQGLPGYGEYKQKVKYRLVPYIW